MNGSVQVHAEDDAIVVSIPLKVGKRGRRWPKVTVTGGEMPARQVARREHSTILKALGRAYRWKRMLESGEFASIADLANAEKINHAYLRRILRLTLLSPAITEAILDRGASKRLQLDGLLNTLSDVRTEQAEQL